VAALCRRRRGTDDERIGRPLGNVFRRREADQRRGVVAHIVGDGEQFEGGERPEDHVDFVPLDQLLRLGAGAGRVAAGVSGDEIDPPAREDVALFLQEREDSLFHLDTALRERAGLDGEQADLEGRLGVNIRGAQCGGGHARRS
jgi:hypothetical protein